MCAIECQRSPRNSTGVTPYEGVVALPMTLSDPKTPHFLYFAPRFIASQRVNVEISNLVH